MRFQDFIHYLKKNFLFLVALSFLSLFSQSALSVDWGVATGDWTTAANWNPNTVPTSVDTANIDFIGGGSATLSTISNSIGNAADLNIGVNTLSNVLTIENNATLTIGNAVTIGTNVGSSGALIIDSSTLITRLLSAGNGTASVTFDNGTLKAGNLAQVNFITGFSAGNLLINSGGLTIDSNGFDIGTTDDFSGSGGLTKTGNGTLTFTGAANSYTGDTEVALGALTIDGGSLGTSSGDINVATGGNATLNIINNANVAADVVTMSSTGNMGTLNLNSGSTLTLNQLVGGAGTGDVIFDNSTLRANSSQANFISGFGAGSDLIINSGGLTIDTNNFVVDASSGFSGPGALIKTGSGTLTFTGANNTYTGNTNVANGTMTIDGGSLGTTSSDINVATAGNATLNINNGANILADDINVATGGTGTLNIASGANVTADLVTVSNAGNIGTLSMGSSGNPATLSLNQLLAGAGTGSASFDGGILKARSTNTSTFIDGFGTNSLVLNSGGLTIDSSGFDIGTTDDFSGSGGLTKTGNGTLTFTGAANSYTGDTEVALGALTIDGGSLGTSSGDINVATGGNATLNIINNANVAADVVTMSSTGNMGTLNLNSGSTLTLNQLVGGAGTGDVIFDNSTLRANSSQANFISGFGAGSDLIINSGGLTIDTNSFTVGATSGFSGSGSLTKIGNGTLTFTNAANTYVGDTEVELGTLTIDGGSLGTTSSDINVATAGNATLNINNGANILADDINVATGGTGTLNIASGANVTADLVTVSNAGNIGTLSMGSSGNPATLSLNQLLAGAGTGSASFDGGILKARSTNTSTFIDGFGTNSLVLNSGGLTIDSSGFDIGTTDDFSGSGGLTKTGNGTLTFTGAANSYTGDTEVALGALTIDGGSLGTSSGDINVATGGNATLNIINNANVAADVVTMSSTGNMGTLNLNSGSTLTLNQLVGGTGTGDVIFDNSTLRANSSQANFISGFGAGSDLIINSGGLTIDTNNFVVDASSGFSGPGALIKTGSGTLTFTGANNTYTGNTNVANGTMTIDGGSLGTTSSDINVATAGNATFNINNGANILADDINVATGGTGTLNIASGANVTADLVTVSNAGNIGTLSMGSSGNPATLSLNQLLAGAGTGSASFDGGILKARSTNTSTFIDGFGTNSLVLNSGGLTIDSSGFDIGTTDDFSGSGGLTKTGNGTLTFTGAANSYTGDTEVALGALTIDDGSLGTSSGDINVATGGNATLNIINNANVAADVVTMSSTGNMGTLNLNSGSTLTLNQLVGGTGTGDVIFDNSTLRANSSQANFISGFGAGSDLIINSGGLTIDTNNFVVDASSGFSGPGALIKTGSGTLTFTGANNTYTGNTNVANGTMTIDGGSLGTTSSDINVATAGNATFNINNGANVTANILTVSTTGNMGTLNIGSPGNPATLSLNQLVAGDGNATANFNGAILKPLANQTNFVTGFGSTNLVIQPGGLTIDTNGFDVTISDSGFSGNGGLTKTGAGTLTLSGINTYTGGTIVIDVVTDTLKAGAPFAFSPSSHYLIEANATLDLAGYPQIIAALDNGGLVSLAGTTAGNQFTITGNLTSVGPGSTFAFLTNLGALIGDHMSIQGTSAGNHLVKVTNQGSNPSTPGQSLEVISTTDGVAQFTLQRGHLDLGVLTYTLQQGLGTFATENNWYLVNTGLTNTGKNIIATALTPAIWSTQFDDIYKRMGEIRQGVRQHCRGHGQVQNNVWVRNYDERININHEPAFDPFHVYLYGLDVGVDKGFITACGDQLFTGAFLGYGRSSPSFPVSTGSIDTNAPYVGLYGTWLNQRGWYLDVVGKVQRFYNKFSTLSDAPSPSSPNDTDYEQWGVGVSAEMGKRFRARNGFFVEPEAQVTYAHFNEVNYTADDIFPVSLDSTDIIQVRGMILVGCTFNKCGKFFEPYLKIGEASQNSRGDSVDISGTHFQPNLDGARTEVGAGLACGVGNHMQFHADYEAITGPNYNIPWAINLGLRYIM